jgi:hypothetical protein
MSDHYLMEKKGVGQMTVPPSKLSEFLDAGWVVIRDPDPKPEVMQVDVPPPPPVALEEQEDQPVPLDEAVDKLGSRNKRAKRG